MSQMLLIRRKSLELVAMSSIKIYRSRNADVCGMKVQANFEKDATNVDYFCTNRLHNTKCVIGGEFLP